MKKTIHLFTKLMLLQLAIVVVLPITVYAQCPVPCTDITKTDIEITKTCDFTNSGPGTPFCCTVIIRNIGNLLATNVEVKDILDLGKIGGPICDGVNNGSNITCSAFVSAGSASSVTCGFGFGGGCGNGDEVCLSISDLSVCGEVTLTICGLEACPNISCTDNVDNKAELVTSTPDDCNSSNNESTTISIALSAVGLNLVGTDPSCGGSCDGSIDLTVTGSAPPYIFLWSPGGEITEDISGLCAGTFTVNVTDDDGCTNTATVILTDPPFIPPALYGIRFDFRPQVLHIAEFNPITGAIIQPSIAQFPTTLINITNGSSTFDPVNRLYIIRAISTSIQHHFVIDVNTGTITNSIVTDAVTEMEFNPITGKLYGVRFDFRPQVLHIAELDPITGAIIQPSIAQFPTTLINITNGSSTFDPVNDLYFIRGISTSIQHHFVIDVNTGTITNSIVTDAVTEMEFNPITGKLYGVRFDFRPQVLHIAELDPITGAIIQPSIAQFPTTLINITNGSSTFDPVNDLYFIRGISPGGIQHHFVIDVNAGTITNSIVTDAVTELEFFSCIPKPLCKTGTNSQETSKPDNGKDVAATETEKSFVEASLIKRSCIHNYPNPLSGETFFHYAIPNSGMVSLEIYDVSGKLIITLLNNEFHEKGNYEELWTTGDIPSGVYYYQFRIADKVLNKKMILTK